MIIHISYLHYVKKTNGYFSWHDILSCMLIKLGCSYTIVPVAGHFH